MVVPNFVVKKMVEEGQAIDGEGNSRIHIVQPHRDLESNWAVDLAKSLEDYLLKICSGEISGGETANFSINFAEAALLLQGSVQVYSRKVEYLYSLVLQALEFISQKSDRTQDQEEDPASQPEASTSRAVRNEDDGQFWYSDDIPVDAKNCLDSLSTKDAFQNRLVKPPANLVVVEGDCLDSTGDGGELETYLLATHDVYRDFILLDPCDATVVDEFLDGNISGEVQYGTYKESSLTSKGHKTFMSPVRQSCGGTARKSTAKKNMNNFGEPSAVPCDIDPPAMSDFPQNGNFDFQMDDNHSEPEFFDDADSDDDDPWKPLNPHDPGNLKVKPFKKVKSPRRKSTRMKASAATIFHLAKPDGPINSQFKVFWESHVDARDRQPASESPPYFEKLRQSLLYGTQDIHGNHGMFHNPEGANNDEDNDDGFGDFGFDMPADFGVDDDFNQEKHDDFVDPHNDNVANNPEEISSQATLEDLCRAHLDSLLASIAETEQQTELVARVTSWKQRIEHNLDEQDSRPPFDIHVYGERVLDKFSMVNDGDAMPFTDVVSGQEKHDIARTFSAMLQLVNEGKVHLDKPAATSSSFCYTSVNPFYVRCGSKQEGPEKRQFPLQKKRGNSATKKRSKEADVNGHASLEKSPQKKRKLSAKKLGVAAMGRCTPESKRKRKSRLVDPPDLPSA